MFTKQTYLLPEDCGSTATASDEQSTLELRRKPPNHQTEERTSICVSKYTTPDRVAPSARYLLAVEEQTNRGCKDTGLVILESRDVNMGLLV